MPSRWRLDQIAYNEKALDWLASAAGARFWGWEIVVMFYSIVTALDGYAAARGHSAPKSHRERRAVVRLHFPRPAGLYNGLCGLSPGARYHRGAPWPKSRGAGRRGAARRLQGACRQR